MIRTLRWALAALMIVSLQNCAKDKNMQSIYDINVTTIDGESLPMETYRGKVLLIVNVASRCGYTPQYEGLEALYEQYKARGFVVLGFPCNQFGAQEPGSEEQIKTFCRTSYGVSFPMFAKIEVNGDNAHPLYRYLKARQPGDSGDGAIKWNFTKFLVDRQGNVVARFASSATPSSLNGAIEKLLDQ